MSEVPLYRSSVQVIVLAPDTPAASVLPSAPATAGSIARVTTRPCLGGHGVYSFGGDGVYVHKHRGHGDHVTPSRRLSCPPTPPTQPRSPGSRRAPGLQCMCLCKFTHTHTYTHAHTHTNTNMFVCERERKRKRESVCVSLALRPRHPGLDREGHDAPLLYNVCVCVWVCVRVCDRERV